MADNINFKVYDPVAQLIAGTGSGGGGGGPFLPLTGGIMTGPIYLNAAPVNGDQLTNKTYVDGKIVNATSTVPGMIQLAGDLIAPATAPQVAAGAISNTKMANMSGPSQLKGSASTGPPNSVTDISLDPSLKMTGSILSVNPNTYRFSFYAVKATAAITITPTTTVNAFSAGVSEIGPSTWSAGIFDNTMYSVAASGIFNITNNDPTLTHYYRIIFIGGGLNEISNGNASVDATFFNTDTNAPLGVIDTIRCLAGTSPQFTNTVTNTVSVQLAAGALINFAVKLTNTGLTNVTIDPEMTKNVSKLIIQRVA